MPDAPASTTPASKATNLPPASMAQPLQQPAPQPATQQTATPPATQQATTPAPAGDPPANDPNAALRQAIQDAVTPIAADLRASVQAANQRIDQALRPTQQPWNPAANGPAVVRPGSLGTGCYRYTRVMQAASGRVGWDQFPLEGHIHHRLRQAYGDFSRSERCENSGVFAPLSSKYIAEMDAGLAQEIQQASQAGITGMDPAEIQQYAQWRVQQGMNAGRFGAAIQQNLSIYDDTFLGVFLSYAESGEFISLLRPMEIWSAIGARQVQFLSNGTFPMMEQTGSMTAYWVGKGRTDDSRRAITKSTPRTGGRNLVAKKLACAIDIPPEFARFGAGSTEAFVRGDMAACMAQEFDQAGYNGAGTAFEPAGIATNPDILTYTALEGADGDFYRIEDLEFQVATMQEQNIRTTRPTFITRPMLAARVRTRRADAVAENDASGPFVAIQLAMGNDGIGYPLVRSTSVPNDRVKNGGDNLTQMLCVEPSEILIARMGVMEFGMTDSHGDNFLSDIKTLRAIQYCDIGLRRDHAAVLCDDLIWDDAAFVTPS